MLLLIPQRYEFSSKSQRKNLFASFSLVVADTTKVRIFKQITTMFWRVPCLRGLLLIPQRYEFSSKSQQKAQPMHLSMCCCWYHKGTNFQANHNKQLSNNYLLALLLIPQRYEFSSKSQLSTMIPVMNYCCCWYHKGTNFQANHNPISWSVSKMVLLLIPQRYEFSSKSQLDDNFTVQCMVVADTTKVRIFKQITTHLCSFLAHLALLLIPQRYEFSSKSQLRNWIIFINCCCCWYHKGTNFQANHNHNLAQTLLMLVVADTTKVRIFKQITTGDDPILYMLRLLLIPQRYEFSSKSQRIINTFSKLFRCCWYHKGTNFQANHNRPMIR